MTITKDFSRKTIRASSNVLRVREFNIMFQFELFKGFSDKIVHGITPREWGSFKEDQPEFEPAMLRLMKETGLATPVTGFQVHKAKIIDVKTRPDKKPRCDGFITQAKNLPVMVKVADCQGVLMFDPVTRGIAAVHSGWRGSVLNIIGKAIVAMKKEFGVDPANLLVAVSPSLGPCCARFSEPHEELPTHFGPYIKGNHVDFWALSADQCAATGVLPSHIEIARVCTQCHPDLYFSHRHGDNGRTGVFIALK